MSDKSHIMDIKWRYSNIQKHGEKSPEGIIQRDILFFGFGKVLSLLLVQNRFSCILVIPKWSNQNYGFLLSKLVTVWFGFITRLIYHWLAVMPGVVSNTLWYNIVLVNIDQYLIFLLQFITFIIMLWLYMALL